MCAAWCSCRTPGIRSGLHGQFCGYTPLCSCLHGQWCRFASRSSGLHGQLCRYAPLLSGLHCADTHPCQAVCRCIFACSGHQIPLIGMLQASESMDLHAPGIRIHGFACSRHQIPLIGTLRAALFFVPGTVFSASIDWHAPGSTVFRARHRFQCLH